MIALVSGTVAVRRADHVVIDCGGVGYRLSVSGETLRHVPAVGKTVLLHAHMVVRDDALQLYGFGTEEERELFLMLLGVQSVGPKVALAVLSGGPPRELLDEHQPEAVAVEELYFGVNVRTAFAVGQARGVILLAAGQRGVPTRSYTPQQVKGAVCGHGRADKIQVARMVARLLGMPSPPSTDHAADALAVAVCDVNRAPLAQAVSGK